MKALILEQQGRLPKYGEIAEPVSADDKHILVSVKAAAIKQIDRIKAAGKHYTSYPSLPAVIGTDGVVALKNGKRAYAHGIGLTGMIAEKALIEKNNWVELPDGLSDEAAAALPNALIGADMALLYRAKIKKGDVVLINGATGITGKIAVQLAKHYKASQIIATGRNPKSLQELKALGADITISLKQEDEQIVNQLIEIQKKTPINFVLDYIWGHPVELILKALQIAKAKKVKVITIGEMAGSQISMASGVLRSTDIKILGSGIGSFSAKKMKKYEQKIMPKRFKLAAEGKLKIDTETVELKDIEKAWLKRTNKRIVVKI